MNRSMIGRIRLYSCLFCILLGWVSAKDLPAENLCITANIPTLPKEWKAVSWESVGNDIYIFAQTPLKDSTGAKYLVFTFDLTVAAKNNYTLVKPNPVPVKCNVDASKLVGGAAVLLTEYEVKKAENSQSGYIYLVALEDAAGAKVKRVAFKDALILKSDDNVRIYSVADYHWIDDDLDGAPDSDASNARPPDKVKSYPCSYTRGKTVDIKAKFKVPNDKLKEIWIRGKSTSADSPLVFEEKKVAISSGEADYDDVSDGKLVNTVRGYITDNRGAPWGLNDPLNLTWEFSLDKKSWSDAGATKHTVYVTLRNPNKDLHNRQETVFNLSCRNGNGKTADKDVFSDVWNDIKDLEVKRMDGKAMRYWNPIQGVSGNDMKAMLADSIGNGTCGSWSELLLKTIKAHDIAGIELMVIDPDPAKFPASTVNGFLIADWKFGKSLHSGPNFIAESTKAADDQQNVNTGDPTIIGGAARTNTYIFPGTNLVVDAPLKGDDALIDGGVTALLAPAWPYSPLPYTRGVQPRGSTLGSCAPTKQPDGQNNKVQTPQDFTNHAVIIYDSDVWDPSYGKSGFKKQNDYENATIAGFYLDHAFLGMLIRKNDAAAEELIWSNRTAPVMTF